jgi:hypothetical protein
MAWGRLEKSESEKAWDAYFAIQLTPEQKAEARAELEKRAAEARAAGVYDALLKLEGTVPLGDFDLDELRRDRD